MAFASDVRNRVTRAMYGTLAEGLEGENQPTPIRVGEGQMSQILQQVGELREDQIPMDNAPEKGAPSRKVFLRVKKGTDEYKRLMRQAAEGEKITAGGHSFTVRKRRENLPTDREYQYVPDAAEKPWRVSKPHWMNKVVAAVENAYVTGTPLTFNISTKHYQHLSPDQADTLQEFFTHPEVRPLLDVDCLVKAVGELRFLKEERLKQRDLAARTPDSRA